MQSEGHTLNAPLYDQRYAQVNFTVTRPRFQGLQAKGASRLLAQILWPQLQAPTRVYIGGIGFDFARRALSGMLHGFAGSDSRVWSVG